MAAGAPTRRLRPGPRRGAPGGGAADPVLTFLCSPNNPTGRADPPEERRPPWPASSPGCWSSTRPTGSSPRPPRLTLRARRRRRRPPRGGGPDVLQDVVDGRRPARLPGGRPRGGRRLRAGGPALPPRRGQAGGRAAGPPLRRRDGASRVAVVPRSGAGSPPPSPNCRVETWPSDANFLLFRPTTEAGPPGVVRSRGGLGARARLFVVAGPHRLPAGDGGAPRGERPVPGRPDRKPAMSHCHDRPSTPRRAARVSRATKETSIEVSVDVDGTGVADVGTGLPFFDHMLTQLGRHGGPRPHGVAPPAISTWTPTTRSRTWGSPWASVVAEALGRQGRGPPVRLDLPSPRRGPGRRGARSVRSALPRLRDRVRPRHARASAPRRSTRSWPRSSGGPS